MPFSGVYIIMAVISILFPLATVALLILIYITLRDIENKIGNPPK
jgi:hypothetical protein